MISFKNFKGDEKLIDDIKDQADSILECLRHKPCHLVREFFLDKPKTDDQEIKGDLLKRFKAEGNKETEFPVLYLICKSEEAAYPIIIAWGLFAIFKSGWDQHYDGIMRKICRYFRQLKTINSKQMDKLAAIIEDSESFRVAYEKLDDELQKLSEDPGLKKAYEIYRSVFSLYDFVAKNFTNYKNKTKVTKVHRRNIETYGLPEVFELGESIERHHFTKAVEHHADQVKTKTEFYELPKSDNQQRNVYQQAISIASRKTISEVSPVCSISQITLAEAQEIIRFCRRTNEPEALVIMLSLILGTSVNKVLSFRFPKGFRKKTLNFPKHEDIAYLGLNLLNKVDMSIRLRLPESVYKRLRMSDMKSVTIDSVHSFIKKKAPFTLKGITNFQWFWLQRNGYDIFMRELLSSEKISLPQSYYSSISDELLQTIWVNYLKDLGFEAEILKTESRIGSLLSVNIIYIKEFFKHLKHSLESAIEKRDFVDTLNSYSLLLHHILILATGHRPGIDVFSTVKHFSKSTSSIRLEDKVPNGISNPRIVFVPEMIFSQLNDYFEVLGLAKKYYLADHPILSQEFEMRISGDSSLIHLIEENLLSSPLNSGNLHHHLSEVWPIPLNWNRHVLRSYFLENEVPQADIDLFMGHQNTPYHRLGQFGGLSLSCGKSITSVISKFFDELHITFTPYFKRIKNAI